MCVFVGWGGGGGGGMIVGMNYYYYYKQVLELSVLYLKHSWKRMKVL